MISILFNILFVLVPLIFFKNTSELFEFNKIITLYVFTILISSVWLIKSVKLKKIIFRRTILDWPLIIFISILILSTIFSIDPRTSIFGYYSRFNGGLLSMISYSLLYWAFVSNMDKVSTKKSIIFLLISTTIASFLGILEHFNFSATCGLMKLGFDNSCWVQDVQNRVFSTFGQPNWLAATIVILIPVLFGTILLKRNESIKKGRLIIFYISLLILFVTLLFTKSRSGILAFFITDAIFSGLAIIKFKKEFIKKLIVFNSIFIALILTIGTPWSPSIFNLKPSNKEVILTTAAEPLLEVGGTESGVIRQIVWEGAFNIWRKYPILGTGPETFAFSYPMFKPVEHNNTSEWDFIYNKAHNEYLNYLATTGILGFLAYLSLIGFIIYLLIQNKTILGFSLLSGFMGILITNFFGFSVVTTSLLFFLAPAMSVALNLDKKDKDEKLKFDSFNSLQKIYLLAAVIISLILLSLVSRYWLADVYYNKARLFNKSNNPVKAREEIAKAIDISYNEANYWSESSLANAEIALLFSENNEYEKGLEFANIAIEESERSTYLSKNNVNFKKTQAGIYYKLLMFNDANIGKIEDVLKSAILISPNDPKLYYQLGLIELKQEKIEEAISNFEKSASLKSNYRDPRYALGSVYKEMGETEKANEIFKNILENIDPNDELTKKLYNEAP